MDDLGTYIKMYRKSLYSDVFLNANLWQLFSYCLFRAQFKDSDYSNGNKVIKLKPGQFRTGRREIAQFFGVSDSVVYKRLQALKDMGMIQLKGDRRGTTVTVVNWGKYQGNTENGNHKSNNTAHNSKHNTEDNSAHTIKEIKKDKKEKKIEDEIPITDDMTDEELFEARAKRMKKEVANGNI